ncbi:MAG: capsular polysaccharide biosynthesis protein CapF [Oscillospiraceae bacterium]|nr:capsular polysaccharide biosynthesis protein CapF [Oscillospiraceae bacterium]
MNILVTGAKGFLGKNLISTLENNFNYNVYQYDVDCEPAVLDKYAAKCSFVFHLAGVNRPKDESEFIEGNVRFTEKLTESLKKNNNKSPILVSSSIQAALDNPYGKSKKASEQIISRYSEATGAPAYIYRITNVFGKWCRPNYNSVIATFCHNIARDLPITINDPQTEMNLVYIDDVITEFVNAIEGVVSYNGEFCTVKPIHTMKLGDIASLIKSFHDSRKTIQVPNLSDKFTKKLYSTYLSYLPHDKFSYPLKMNIDSRGSFTEFIRTPERGQLSVNVSRAGIVKGNHWHHTKNEKFLVVSGEGIIRFRQVDSDDILEYRVNGKDHLVLDIPPGYTHNIENTGRVDMVTVMWANECFDPENPDTFMLEV